MRVLVVDDRRDAADSLAELLALELGCQMAVAYDGRSALERALAEPFDVLMLDIRMPGFGGVDVVREFARIRREEANGAPKPTAPLLLAMTGIEVSDSLAEIDGIFHGAFAKPVDAPALFALLRRHWQGEPQARQQTPAELSELICQLARKSVPILLARGHVLSFDYRGPGLVLESDQDALRAGLYRLLFAAADMTGGGHILLDASVRSDAAGAWILSVQFSAAGAVLAPAALGEVLARSELIDLPGPQGAVTRAAAGTCPHTGAHLHCLIDPDDGVLLQFEWPCRAEAAVDAAADALGAQVWIIDARAVPSTVLQRRLWRLGWSVRRFPSFAVALESAARMQAQEAMPELVVVIEGVEDPDARGLAALRAVLPRGARCVRVVPIGSTALRGPDASRDCAVHLDPISPAELSALTRHRHRPVPPAASAPPERPRLLVVDDMEVNRLVASGLAEALGYEVDSVADGLDAIRHCRQSPPDVVLMDINMPVLGGLDATQRIRHLQRLGRMPPFAILAATATVDQDIADQCRLVGMDGYLSKPLALQVLKEELRRVTLHAPY